MTQEVSPYPVVSLPAVLDVRAAEPLRAELLGHRGGPLSIDAAAVERLGGLCLQVLMSTLKTWKTDGQSLIFLNVSQALKEQWQSFGVSPEELVAQDAA